MDSTPEAPGLLQRVENSIAGSSFNEHLLNIFKAVLSTAPFTGGISPLITDYIPSSRLFRVEHFARQVAEDLKRLADRVDEKVIETDEFAFVFERSLRGAAEHYQCEKLQAFRGILVNAAMRSAVQQEEKEHFLVLVDKLSVLQLRILRFSAEPRQYLADLKIEEHTVRGGFSEMFQVVLPGLNKDTIESAFQDLYLLGMISTNKHIFHTMTSTQGLQLLEGRVTDLGLRFIGYCRVPR